MRRPARRSAIGGRAVTLATILPWLCLAEAAVQPITEPSSEPISEPIFENCPGC